MTGFANASAILFLNKADLLAEKLKDPDQQIAATFDDFPGMPGSYPDAINFFKTKFRDLKDNHQKELYIQWVKWTFSPNRQRHDRYRHKPAVRRHGRGHRHHRYVESWGT